MKGIEIIYDLIHQDKDYEHESKIISSIIDKKFKNKKIDLLDVACGSGNHLYFFDKKYKCCGFDINKKLVDIARKKNLEVVCQDMRNFKIDKKFDVIVCLFGSIAHLKNYEELKMTIGSMKKHLNKNGMIIIEPWLFLNQYCPRTASRYISEDLFVTSANTLKNNIATLKKTYKYKTKTYKTNIDICCFTKEEYFSAAKEFGFKIKQIQEKLEKDFGNGILILT